MHSLSFSARQAATAMTLFGLLSGILGCQNGEKTTEPQASLFDGKVSFCYSSEFKDYAKQGATGYPELDNTNSPSLSAFNEYLEGLNRAIVPISRRNLADTVVTGAKNWARLCNTELPETAETYTRWGRQALDPDFDKSKAKEYPRHPLFETHKLRHRYWFDGDRLVHVEIRATPK